MTTNQWVPIVKPVGSSPVVFLPCARRPNSVTVTNAEYFKGPWTSLTYSSFTWYGNYLVLRFADTEGISNMDMYTARMNLVVQ